MLCWQFAPNCNLNHMTTVAVIPVKQLANAKQRLAGVLSPRLRRDLFRAMFSDVLEAATTCDRIDRVIVVTSDDEVGGVAREFGAEVRPEPANPGLIEAVTQTAAQLADESVHAMVFLPADVPLVSVEELEIVLDGFGRGDGAEMMIVPAQDLGGSNCLACSPPNCMAFGFGEDSFRRHLRLAEETGVATSVAKLPGLGLDVDTPDDLYAVAGILREQGLDTNTHRFLIESGILHRLSEGLERIG